MILALATLIASGFDLPSAGVGPSLPDLFGAIPPLFPGAPPGPEPMPEQEENSRRPPEAGDGDEMPQDEEEPPCPE